MSAIQKSNIYGGQPSDGDAASQPGSDAIVVIPAIPPTEIEYISASYAVGVHDFDDPANLYRSFFGRLLVFEGRLQPDLLSGTYANLSNGGVGVNNALFNPLPSNIGRVRFDVMFHDFRKGPFEFRFGHGTALGPLTSQSGNPLTVILFNGMCYINGTAHSDQFSQLLHVQASQYSTATGVQVGPFKEK